MMSACCMEPAEGQSVIYQFANKRLQAFYERHEPEYAEDTLGIIIETCLAITGKEPKVWKITKKKSPFSPTVEEKVLLDVHEYLDG